MEMDSFDPVCLSVCLQIVIGVRMLRYYQECCTSTCCVLVHSPPPINYTTINYTIDRHK